MAIPAPSGWHPAAARFGTIVTIAITAGNLFGAYKLIAIPTLLFGAGGAGFFVVPYAIMIAPIVYIMYPAIWTAAHAKGYTNAADLIGGSHGVQALGLAVALTGLLACIPYLALQLIGLRIGLAALGIETDGVIGFLPRAGTVLVLVALTYKSGLAGLKSLALIKTGLIFALLLAILIAVPTHVGGYRAMFAAIPADRLILPTSESFDFFTYFTLGLGAALSLWLYPHSIAGTLSAASADTVRKTTFALPVYSLSLGLMALAGFAAVAVGVEKMPEFTASFERYGAIFAVPALIISIFPTWFTYLALAAIILGSVVPAASVSVSTATVCARTIYRDYLHPGCSDARETQVARLLSVLLKIGALLFLFDIPLAQAMSMHLLGGAAMINILPALVSATFGPFWNGRALLAGWAIGLTTSLSLAMAGEWHPIFVFSFFGTAFPCYIAIVALAVNAAVTAVLSPVLKAAR